MNLQFYSKLEGLVMVLKPANSASQDIFELMQLPANSWVWLRPAELQVLSRLGFTVWVRPAGTDLCNAVRLEIV